MADLQTPLEWFSTPTNYEGIALAYGVLTVSAGCAAALNGSTWFTAGIGIASAWMFTTVTIPLVAHYWSWQWPWWLVLASGWGVLSVIALRSMIKAGLRVEQRVNNIVDGRIRRWLPETPEGGDVKP